MTDVPAGRLFLGETLDAEGARSGDRVLLKSADLTTHGVIVGMTGSGKTGLGVSLIEEALLQGIPTLIIDPKGDLGNLLLAFPDLSPESFAPWVEDADPGEVARSWREGLASWGMDGSRVQALADSAEFTIYTPGSTSGVPLNVIGGLQRPPEGTDEETIAEEIGGYVSGLLGLVGVEADPLSSREHILMSNLISLSWSNGMDLDLPTLVGQVQSPPLRKLGVFELDEFYPQAERTKLAVRLNGLLASPAFAAWGKGQPLDMDALLSPGGRPGCAIVSIAHLSDEERQFVVTLVLSQLVTWMRRQPGTDQLRVLVYFDEVAGYVPPTAVPPAKRPILTLLKQARAFGVGLVLATQNPVDVDYKALSNAGTWMIGRLQTEQDTSRLVSGLSAADGSVDTSALAGTIGSLDKREFLLRRPGSAATEIFTSRWAMSYLRGPLTREQISSLMGKRSNAGDAAPAGEPASAPSAASASATPSVTPTPASAEGSSGTVASSYAVGNGAGGDDTTTVVMPTVATGVAVQWVDPAAPWISQVGGNPSGTVLEPALVATVELLFDDTKLDLRDAQQFEGVYFPLGTTADPASIQAVDHDARDFRAEPPPAALYRIPEVKLSDKAYFTKAQKDLVDHLFRTQTVDILLNSELKLVGRPGESAEEFAARCEAAADAGADAESAKVASRIQAKMERVKGALATAEDRVAQAEQAQSSRRNDELLSGAGDLLGALFGGRKSARSLASKVGTAGRRRGRSSEAAQRVATANNRVEEKTAELADLADELQDAIADIADAWDTKAEAVETVQVPLEKADIKVSQMSLVWIPV